MAATTLSNSPGAIPCPAASRTWAGVIVPVTVPSCGHSGVAARTASGARLVPWQSQTTIAPTVCLWPKWMWAWATVLVRFS
jgi:hypothetical protein